MLKTPYSILDKEQKEKCVASGRFEDPTLKFYDSEEEAAKKIFALHFNDPVESVTDIYEGEATINNRYVVIMYGDSDLIDSLRSKD